MNRNNHPTKYMTRGYFFRTLLILGAIALLVFCMPRGNQVKYDFKEGKPWNYAPVIAKENFPILKSEQVLNQEHDSLFKNYQPIYTMDADVADRQAALFMTAFDSTLKATTPAIYRSHILNQLRHIYEVGVMKVEDYERLAASQTKKITVSTQNTGHTLMLKHVFTPKSAYEYLINDPDSAKYQRSVLQHCNLSRFLESNLTYDEKHSKQKERELEKQLVRYSGQVLAGQKIIDRGDIVDAKAYNILRSMQVHQEGRKRSSAEQFSQLGGQVIYVSVVVICLLVFYNQFRRNFLQHSRTVMLIALLTLVFPLVTYALVRYTQLSVYIIPYCILPIYIHVFLDSRSAFITHLCSTLLSAIVLPSPFEFLVVQTVAGLVAIYSLKQLTQRSELFRAVIQVTLTSMLCYSCFDLMRMSLFAGDSLDYAIYASILSGGVLMLISYLLLIPFERIFKFTSTVTLVELSNTNNDVLLRLSEEAPGTFQHSMQVANLAAAVANELGANTLQVRTAALYHDIGKLENPIYFTENQNGYNPHDTKSYVESAQIIIRHVLYGLELAEKYQLPELIRDFIASHHGKGKVKYFYIKYKNENPLLEVDEKFFTYPGPNPNSAEQAILMMADAVEAASRSLSEHTEKNISDLVARIVDTQVQEGYFTECPLTFKDITTAKKVLTNKLMTIYHTRVSYPTLNKQD